MAGKKKSFGEKLGKGLKTHYTRIATGGRTSVASPKPKKKATGGGTSAATKKATERARKRAAAGTLRKKSGR